MNRPRWHMEHLDALRGFAILAVVWVHTGLASNLYPFWSQIAFSGQRGVQLFFVVSAFTLALSSDNRRRKEQRPTTNFFIRRFFRLAPLYYLDILLTLLSRSPISGSWRDVLLGFAFLQGLGYHAIIHVAPGTWSIADEALF